VNDTIPNEADWTGWKADVESRFAYRTYFGRSNSEMRLRYDASPIEVFEELHFMPVKAFHYYVLGFRDSVLARANPDDIDNATAADCFLGLIAVRAREQRSDVTPIWHELRAAVAFVAEHQADYDADEGIFGSFAKKRAQIEALIQGHD
jgi:hypothetical protein